MKAMGEKPLRKHETYWLKLVRGRWQAIQWLSVEGMITKLSLAMKKGNRFQIVHKAIEISPCITKLGKASWSQNQSTDSCG